MAVNKDLPALKFALPAGIGDLSWIYCKLASLERRLHFYVASGGKTPNPRSGRALPYLRLLPNVTKSANGEFYTKDVLESPDRVWEITDEVLERAAEAPVYLEANSHLEAGRRIEDFLPGLETQFHYEMQQPAKYAALADEVRPAGRYMVFYTSNIALNDKWGGWSADQWVDMMSRCVNEWSVDSGIVLVGAEYDKDMAAQIMKAAKGRVPVLDLVGNADLATVFELIRGAYYTVGFPSGIPIMASTMECPVMMFYPKHLRNMQTAWVDPAYIQNGFYKGCSFCSVDQAFGWLTEVRPMELPR